MPTTTYFGVPGNYPFGTYINFNPATNFTTLYRSGYVWYFDGIGIMPMVADVTVSALNETTWINYTVSIYGEQAIYALGEEPRYALIDGVNCSEGAGWTWAGGWTIVDSASVSVALDFSVTGGGAPGELTFETSTASYDPGTLVATEGTFNTELTALSQLSLMDGDGRVLSLYVTSGMLYGVNCSLTMSNSGGQYRLFSILDVGTIRVDFNMSNLEVSINNVPRQMSSGEAFSTVPGDSVVISWGNQIPMLLPITFVMGMTGLVSLAVGPAYLVWKVKKKEYSTAVKGIVTGVIITVVGIALFLAWLWA